MKGLKEGHIELKIYATLLVHFCDLISINLSLKYLRITLSGCKHKGIKKFEYKSIQLHNRN